MAETLSLDQILAHYDEIANAPAPERKIETQAIPSLHVSQLPYSVNKDNIRQFFEKVGCVIKSCRVVLKGGKFTGVAFLDVADKKSVELGIGLHRSLFRDRKINVRPTVTQSELAHIAAARERHVADLPRPVCYAFTEGKCTRGAACKYSHEADAPKSKKPKATVADLAEKQQREPETSDEEIEPPAATVNPEPQKKRAKKKREPVEQKSTKAKCSEDVEAKIKELCAPAVEEAPTIKKLKKKRVADPDQLAQKKSKKQSPAKGDAALEGKAKSSNQKSPGMAALLKRKKAQLHRQVQNDEEK